MSAAVPTLEPGAYARSVLRPVRALEDTPGMPEAIARVVTESTGRVCGVCGLERMGHGPESRWLGHTEHPWEGVPATADMLARARELTATAYENRRSA